MNYYKKGTMYIATESEFDYPVISKEEFDEHFSECINREIPNNEPSIEEYAVAGRIVMGEDVAE